MTKNELCYIFLFASISVEELVVENFHIYFETFCFVDLGIDFHLHYIIQFLFQVVKSMIELFDKFRLLHLFGSYRSLLLILMAKGSFYKFPI